MPSTTHQVADESTLPESWEPDWTDPWYADQLPDAERLQLELARGPGGRDTSWLDRLDAATLSASDRLELLTMLEEQVRWLQAAIVRSLAVIQASDETTKKYAQEEVSLALRIPVRTAQNRMRQASTLVGELPATVEAMAAGRISLEHARTLTDAVWKLPPDEPELVARLQESVLPKAPHLTNSQFRAEVKKASLRIDPSSAEQRHQRALADRTVRFEPADDGMALLPVVLDAPSAQLIYTRLTTAATMLPVSDPRTMDQRRADLFVDAMLCGLPLDALPKPHGRRPSINVVVSADTLLELDDLPAHLTGYGPITAETARRLAADESGTWRRLLTDPDTGELLDASPDRYRPSPRLRAFTSARDDVCAFPTCNQPGYRCEYDHILEFLDGGRTCRCNGALACRRHNQCKIDSAWSYVRNSDGSFTWTTDSGRSYTGGSSRPWTSPADRSPGPEPPPRISVADLRERENNRYLALLRRWRAERKAAQDAGNREQFVVARRALAAIRRQRKRELAHRKDPEVPPY